MELSGWAILRKYHFEQNGVLDVVEAFNKITAKINSENHKLKSDVVLFEVSKGLQESGFIVETGKKKGNKIQVPVLFGLNGKMEKSFDADAYNEKEGFVLEVEAGRALLNNQFLKDLFQACMMHDVKYLGIAVRNIYGRSNDFKKIITFIDALYSSNRLSLPLKGILIIGY